MKKLLVILLVLALIIGITSAYVCIHKQDNEAVRTFKNKLNILEVKSDLGRGVTPEAIKIKADLFNPCKK